MQEEKRLKEKLAKGKEAEETTMQQTEDDKAHLPDPPQTPNTRDARSEAPAHCAYTGERSTSGNMTGLSPQEETDFLVKANQNKKNRSVVWWCGNVSLKGALTE